jgi:predicted ATPase
MKKIVLTGGPHSGKSTLLAALSARGARVLAESAIGVINDLVASIGIEAAREWRAAHVADFQLTIARRQHQAELAVGGDGVVWLDRGIIDTIAYCRLYQIEAPEELRQLAARSHYDLAIVCELVTPFHSRQETGRTSDEERARAVEGLVERTYADFNVRTLRLAFGPVPERLEMLQRLSRTPEK